MLRPLAALVLALALAPASAVAQPGDSGSLEGFVSEVYRTYELGKMPQDFSMRGGLPILSNRFRALVLKDRKQAGGEIGIISGDPICQCQDIVKFRLTSVRVGGDSETALVDVGYRNGPDAGKLKLTLVYGDRGWLIDDITTADMPSYRTILKSELR